MDDMVNHPPHYTKGKIEVLDFILDQKLDYLSGQVVKYVCRHEHKEDPLQDMKKARFYLDKKIAELEVMEKLRDDLEDKQLEMDLQTIGLGQKQPSRHKCSIECLGDLHEND